MINDIEKKKYILSSVDNVLNLLNLFFDYEELTVNDMARLLSISRSTAFRFAVTLENKGFLAKTDHASYRLGLNLFSLGMLAYNRMELVSVIHPHLQNLAEESGETCHLAMLDDAVHVMFIDRALGTNQLKMETALGYRQYAHLTATGKAILAYQSEQTVNQYLKQAGFPQLTQHSLPHAAALLQVLDAIRQAGDACDDEEAEDGLTCYAVPLLDVTGRSYGAVSISGPTTRMKKNKESHIQRLQTLVASVSKTLIP